MKKHPLDMLYDMQAHMSALEDDNKYHDEIDALNERMIEQHRLMERLIGLCEMYAGNHGHLPSGLKLVNEAGLMVASGNGILE